MLHVTSFTFDTYKVDTINSTISFTFRVKFKCGIEKTFTDKLIFQNISPESWEKIPKSVLEPTLQSLLLMIGINYWCIFPTNNIYIKEFTLTHEQAQFWNSLYLNGLGEFFYKMKIDFRKLIAFPYSDSATVPTPTKFERPKKALLLNGAGKDSILSAEMLKTSNIPFDFFSFAPTPAHKRITELVGAETISVTRRRDPWINFAVSWSKASNDYPSVSTFTFIAVLLAELVGYDSIIFSNERSADFGNLTYLGLEVNHQWCKSTEAEKLINNYIQKFITPSISTSSLLREYSELEIVKNFVKYPQYFHDVTSCNAYFWLSQSEQFFMRKAYWCKKCPKCIFLFACFSAFLPKKEVISIFGANLYTNKRLIPLIKRILGIEGFKPLDCVGEPEEMILAMHYASSSGEYSGEPAIKLFEEHFPANYDFNKIKQKVFTNRQRLSK